MYWTVEIKMKFSFDVRLQEDYIGEPSPSKMPFTRCLQENALMLFLQHLAEYDFLYPAKSCLRTKIWLDILIL